MIRVSQERFILGSGILLSLVGIWGFQSQVLQGIAVILGSGCISYVTMQWVLRQDRERAARVIAADAYLQFLRQMDQRAMPVNSQRPPACRGCCHYHGKRYGGSLLICAMHPYGVNSQDCADWNVGVDRCGPQPVSYYPSPLNTTADQGGEGRTHA